MSPSKKHWAILFGISFLLHGWRMNRNSAYELWRKERRFLEFFILHLGKVWYSKFFHASSKCCVNWNERVSWYAIWKLRECRFQYTKWFRIQAMLNNSDFMVYLTELAECGFVTRYKESLMFVNKFLSPSILNRFLSLIGHLKAKNI